VNTMLHVPLLTAAGRHSKVIAAVLPGQQLGALNLQVTAANRTSLLQKRKPTSRFVCVLINDNIIEAALQSSCCCQLAVLRSDARLCCRKCTHVHYKTQISRSFSDCLPERLQYAKVMSVTAVSECQLATPPSSAED
jgi:hypothetical protein